MSIGGVDYELVEEQLGRPPRGLVSIRKWCDKGYPQVIVTKPILTDIGERRELFPTTFYLTCPHLIKLIYHLESSGLIKGVQNLYNEDPSFREDLLKSQREYKDYRSNLLPKGDEGSFKDLKGMGIGGIKGQGIKCLHAHYAHYLILGGNPVGQLVQGLISHHHCEDPCIKEKKGDKGS